MQPHDEQIKEKKIVENNIKKTYVSNKNLDGLTSLIVLADLNLLHVTLSSSSWLAALQSANIEGRLRLCLFLKKKMVNIIMYKILNIK